MNLLNIFNQNNVSWLTYAGGIALSLFACFVAYVVIMGLYICARKKHPSAKYWIELLFILIGLSFSFLMKLAILADIKLENESVKDFELSNYVAYCFSAIYSLVGSLQFEGLPFSFHEMPPELSSLYFGSSIISGLILLSVITAKASYEIYSYLSLQFSKIFDLIPRKKSYYIFNSLTKDSIILAIDIKEKNKKNSVIIFAGNNIPSFSRNNPLCREVMNNSFFYYSLSNGADTKKSVLARLRLKKCNLSMLTFDLENQIQFKKETRGKKREKKLKSKDSIAGVNRQRKKKRIKKQTNECASKSKDINAKNNAQETNTKKRAQKRICEFYFELDDDKKPNQEKNTSDAFFELDHIIEDVFKIKKPKHCIRCIEERKRIARNRVTRAFVKQLYDLYNSFEQINVDKANCFTYNKDDGALNSNVSFNSDDLQTLTNKYKAVEKEIEIKKISLEENEKIVRAIQKYNTQNAEKIADACLKYIHKVAKYRRWLVSEHYILTFSDSNYEFYTRSLQEKVGEIAKNLYSAFKRSFGSIKKYSSIFGEDNSKKKSKNINLNLMAKDYSELIARKSSFEEWKNITKENYDDGTFENMFASVFLKTLSEYLTAANQIHVVNEAHLTSISLVEKRSEAIRDKLEKEKEWAEKKGQVSAIPSFEETLLNHLAYTDSGNNDYKALILGFGGNGQSALNALFYDSAVINKNCELNGFYADVFDQNIKGLDAIFAKNHPLYRCFTVLEGDAVPINEAENVYNQKTADNADNDGEFLSSEIKTDQKDSGQAETQVDEKRKYNIIKNDDIDSVYKALYKGKSIVEEKNDMTFPLIQFHDKSCTSLRFINFFDSVTGSSRGKTKNDYHIIVIAFGSDRKNISIANTIIDDIRRECLYSTAEGSSFKQCIAVNIRDKDNLDKLNWTDKDKMNENLKNLVVFSFGAKENIYSYDMILDYTDQYIYSTNYESMSSIAYMEHTDKLSKDIKNVLNGENADPSTKEISNDNRNKEIEKLMKEIVTLRATANTTYFSCLKNQVSYLRLDNTKMETNRISSVYGDVMRSIIKTLGLQLNGEITLDYDAIKALLLIEHEKWCRFHISEGWIYNKERDNFAKMHDCLIPLKFVDYDKYGFDLINVVMQWKELNAELDAQRNAEGSSSNDEIAKKRTGKGKGRGRNEPQLLNMSSTMKE